MGNSFKNQTLKEQNHTEKQKINQIFASSILYLTLDF